MRIHAMQESKVPEAKLTKDVACVDGFEVGVAQCSTAFCAFHAEGDYDVVGCSQSFWAFSRAKLGYSGESFRQCGCIVRCSLSSLRATCQHLQTRCPAGVTTYACSEWSPVDAEANSLGGGDADFDQEGR